MKGKKLLAGLLSAAMVFSSVSFTAFADDETDVYAIGNTTENDFRTVVSAAKDTDGNGEVTFKIFGKVTLTKDAAVNGNEEYVLNQADSNIKKINFVNGDDDAELVLDNNDGDKGLWIKLNSADEDAQINFENLKLSKERAHWASDMGHSANYFAAVIRDNANGTVTYTNCEFTNGSCNNLYGNTVYKDCDFKNSSEYCLWIYGGKTIVTGTENNFVGAKGVKVYTESYDPDTGITATIENSKFDISGKPAVVASVPSTIELNSVDASACGLGLLQSEPKEHTDGPYAEITVDGKTPSFVAKVGTSFFTDIEGANDKAKGDTSKIETVVAQVGGVAYTSLAEAVAAAQSGDTVTLLCDTKGNGIIINDKGDITALTIDFNGYTYTIDGYTVGSPNTETSGFQIKATNNGEFNFAAPDITFKNGKITSEKAAIAIQNYSNLTLEDMTVELTTDINKISFTSAPYTLSNNNGNTVLKGNTNIIATKNYPKAVAFDVCRYAKYQGVSVTLDESMTGTIDGNIEISGSKHGDEPFDLVIKNGNVNGNIIPYSGVSGQKVAISGGTFSTDVSDYVEDGCKLRYVNGRYVAGEDNSTDTIALTFVQHKDEVNVYDIVLSGDNKNINRLNAAEFEFALDAKDKLTYEIKTADGLANIQPDVNKYVFYFDGKDGVTNDTGKEIKIGTVVFDGYGKFTFGATSGRATATTTADNLVTEFVTTNETGKGTLKIDEDANKIDGKITVPTQTLTINVAMNHKVTDNAATYQDMTVEISGGDLGKDTKVFNLGTDGVALASNGVYTIKADLTQNRLYTVTVKGAGYRTARYTVNMSADKTMNFWNNVMTSDVTVVDDVNAKKNFLAGDIVKDGVINIYDLSAVVAYFGADNLPNDNPTYAKYDINRDGTIDMMDISIVLTSWGE